MRTRAQARLLPDGLRLHLQDGPIDIVLQAFGAEDQIQIAYRAAADRFVTVLDELCSELPGLRARASVGGDEPGGTVARRMLAAVLPYADETFITPMAAVAGAVAEEILSAMTTAADLRRAYVNDGGDIAVHIAPGEELVVGMADEMGRSLFGTVVLGSEQPVRTLGLGASAAKAASIGPSLSRGLKRCASQNQDYFAASARGIATSGWRGRSFSLGIADSVTVLAKTAAMADAAATIVANAVDLPGHPRISRVAACELSPDNDLGHRLVTRGVGELTSGEITRALRGGANCAESLVSRGLIIAAALNLQGSTWVVPTVDPAHIPLGQMKSSQIGSTKQAASSVERSQLHA